MKFLRHVYDYVAAYYIICLHNTWTTVRKGGRVHSSFRVLLLMGLLIDYLESRSRVKNTLNDAVCAERTANRYYIVLVVSWSVRVLEVRCKCC